MLPLAIDEVVAAVRETLIQCLVLRAHVFYASIGQYSPTLTTQCIAPSVYCSICAEMSDSMCHKRALSVRYRLPDPAAGAGRTVSQGSLLSSPFRLHSTRPYQDGLSRRRVVAWPAECYVVATAIMAAPWGRHWLWQSVQYKGHGDVQLPTTSR